MVWYGLFPTHKHGCRKEDYTQALVSEGGHEIENFSTKGCFGSSDWLKKFHHF